MTLGEDIVTKRSNYSVPETMERIKRLLESKHLVIFATLDHSGEARKAGLEMRPTQVLVFGSPRAGTPLMIAVPPLALDLPLKALVSEDAEGACWLSYTAPQFLAERFGLTAEQVQGFGGLFHAIEGVVG